MIKLKDLLIEGLDLKKLEAAIKDFQKKIAKQGRVTNARDEQHLEQLIKVYKQMGGKKIKEGKLSEKKFIPTVTIEKYNNVVMVKKFKTEKDADKFIKQFNKKNQLKRKKGFWGNPKTGVELFRNF
jgi:ribosomal protein S21|tara:strand:- start:1105 stop:1482 length:378 start_codon:yes stop_codon:yes gene_type:complete